MRKILVLLCAVLLSVGCNDGDIIEFELGFDDIETVNYCGDLVLYKIKEEPFESLSLELNTSIEDLISDYNNSDGEATFNLSNTSNSFIYRTYSDAYTTTLANNLFCQQTPPNVTITNNSESESGEAKITISLEQDDEDGIPASIEDQDLDGDGDPATNPTDTDQDGIPDYLDIDDDGDNVATIDENPNYTSEDGFANAQDTDNDDIPDYLDTDDDGDGILTRDEENDTQDQNPKNDFTGGTSTPDYLNPLVDSTVAATGYTVHTIYQTYTFEIDLFNFSLPPLTQTDMFFGSFDVSATLTGTPDFN